MSDKLKKFKKGPVVKLPKKLGVKKVAESEKKKKDDDVKEQNYSDRDLQVPGICIGTTKQINSNVETEENSDDDFAVPNAKSTKERNFIPNSPESPDIDLEIQAPGYRGKPKQRQPKTKVKVEKQTQPKSQNAGGRRKNKKDLEYALLFTASEEEKTRNIEQRLNNVLECSFNQNLPEDTEFYVKNEIHLESTSGISGRLQQFVNPERKLWNLSSAEEIKSKEYETDVITESKKRLENEKNEITSSTNILVEKTEPSLPTDFIKPHLVNFISPIRFKRRLSSQDVEPESKSIKSNQLISHADTQTSVNRSNQPEESSKKGVDKLASDMLYLLRSKRHSDLVIYGREEKGIKTHQLMFEARCPKLLKEVVYEQSASGDQRAVVALTCFSTKALKAFVRWVYGGVVEESVMRKNLAELQQLEVKFQVDIGTRDLQAQVQPSAEDSIILIESESPIVNDKNLENLIPPVVNEKEEQTEPENEDKNQESFTRPFESLLPDCSLLDISEAGTLKEPEPEVSDRTICKSPDLFNEEAEVVEGTPQFNFSELDTPTPPQFLKDSDVVVRSECKSPDLFADEDDLFGDEDLFADEDPENQAWTPQVNSSLRETSPVQVNFTCPTPGPSEDFFPGGDSYIFANIPSMIIHEDENARQTTGTPIRGRATQKQKKKAGGKSRKSLSQDTRAPVTTVEFPSFTPLNMSPAVNNRNLGAVNNPCGTPMLNYSLLDTPILKKELKRFGLKPLPRSKAKKILRHIHLETHK